MFHSSGNPNTPVFNSRVDSKSRTSYRLSWVTESYATIDEYRLLYRKLPVSIVGLSMFLHILKAISAVRLFLGQYCNH